MAEAALAVTGGDRNGQAQGESATTGLLGPGAGTSSHLAMEEHAAWPMISRLPVTVSARIPAVGFTVASLLALAAGQTVESEWPVVEDVPLKAGDLQVGWSEFEVVRERMALRLTKLA